MILLLAGCSGEETKAAASTKPAPPAPELVDSPSMEYLPRPEQAPGWILMGEPQVFPAKQIGDYAGVEARHYLSYDVIDLTVGEYDRPDRAGRATVEIFRFPDYVKAFGAFSTRTLPGAPLGLENASVVGSTSALAWSGPFVVRIVSLAGPADSEPVRALAAAVVGPMPKAPGRPAVFQFFPDQNRVPGSEQFVAGPVFGQPYLARGFVAEFQIGTDRIEGMILPAPSKETATAILNRFKTLYATNGRLLDPVPNLGEDNFVGEDRFLGRAAAYRIDRFVVAFKGFGDKQPLIDLAIASNQRILNSILRQLQAAEKEARMAGAGAQGARAPGAAPTQTQTESPEPAQTGEPQTAPPPAAVPSPPPAETAPPTTTTAPPPTTT